MTALLFLLLLLLLLVIVVVVAIAIVIIIIVIIIITTTIIIIIIIPAGSMTIIIRRVATQSAGLARWRDLPQAAEYRTADDQRLKSEVNRHIPEVTPNTNMELRLPESTTRRPSEWNECTYLQRASG